MLEKVKPRDPEIIPVNPNLDAGKLRPNRGYLKLKLENKMNKTLLKKSVILTAVVAVVGFILPFFGLEVPVDSLVDAGDGLQVQELVNLGIGLLMAVLAKLGFDYQAKKNNTENNNG